MIESIIAVYFILMPGGRWEFVTIEEAPSLAVCRYEAAEIWKAFDNTAGNMRLVCADDRRVEI